MNRFFKYCLILIVLTGKVFALGATQIWLEPVPGTESEKYYVGQTIKMQLRINTFGEKITGASAFLTLNTEYLRIKPQNDGTPFKSGTFFSRSPSINGYHDDTPDNPNKNGIPGLQLDYFQQTQVAVGGERPYESGSGVIAYFDVVIVGIPETAGHEYLIDFDNDFFNLRETGYYIHGKPGQRQKYRMMIPFTLDILGSSIDPPFADTTIIPGDFLEKSLRDHFYGEDFDKDDAIWSYEILKDVEGVVIELDTTDNKDLFTITTGANSQGLLQLNMIMGIEGSSFKTNQVWNIAVNYPPEWVTPFPEIEIMEDIEYNLPVSEIVVDQDNDYDELSFTVEGDSMVSIEHSGQYLDILSKQDWYGETKVTITVTDTLSPAISKEINISVIAVNDPPVIDFSQLPGISIDTLILHHDEEKDINLNLAASDVDDNNLTWYNSSDEKLEMSIDQNNQLTVSVSEDYPDFYGVIPVELSVYDDAALGATDTLYIDVRSYAPEISSIAPILLHVDSIEVLNLDDYVLDKDTPRENLTFRFSAIDSTTKQVDNKVHLNFDDSSHQLSISSDQDHNASNYLVIEVEDNDNNTTIRQVILIVTDSYAPKFLNIPPIIVYQNSVKEVDLFNYVFDVRDKKEALEFEVTGNNLFKNVSLSANILTFESYPDKFGSDTLTLSVTNSYNLSSSEEIVAYCIPEDGKPVIFDIADLNLYWRRNYDWIDLDDYVFDAFTPDSELVWIIDYDEDLIDLTHFENNTIELQTKDLVGSGSIELSVTNKDGLTRTKNVNITIQKDTEPVWGSFNDIYLVRTQPVKSMEWKIFDKVSDNETPAEELQFSAQYNSNIIDVDIDNVSGEVVISIIDTTEEQTDLRFIATDQSQNSVTSQKINIFIGDGLPPVWRNIPTIYIKNTEIFTGLKLLDYCRDPDDLESDLVFSAIPSNANIKVEIDADTRITVTPENGVYGENFYIIFKAEDTQNNSVSTSVKLIITNALPPSGFVNYIVNPVLSKRVDFVVSTDSRVEEVSANFKKLPATNINLRFSQLTNNDDGIVWTDDHRFQDEGAYRLIVGMKDVSNFVTYDTLMMSVEFPDNNGAQVAMGNDTETMRLEYPEHHYNNKMFFITESNLSLDNNLLSKSIGHQDVYRKKYKIRSGIASEEILMTLRYKPKQFMDKYHSFYKVVDESLVPVETFINDEGEFIGYISEDCEICFGPSSMAAEEEILPENHFLTYPNPFNPTVNLKFILKAQKHVEMIVYNLRGQKVYSEQHYFNPGINEMAWHGINQKGEMMPSGVYFVLLQKNNKPMKIKKVTLFK